MWPLNNYPQYGNQPNGFTAPKPNSNFSNFNTAFAQVQPKPGTGIAATTNMPWMPNMPNMGFNPGPNMGFDPNVGYTPMPWQETKPDWYGGDYFTGLMNAKSGSKVDGGVKEGGKGSLSGKGSIDGVNFKSGDGERYELKVESGKSYNLLSDAGIGLNGTYGKDSSGETVLTDIALSVGGKIVTLADDGTLRVDGKAFDKKKNNLEGLVTENKDGTYTVKANGYEFELKASENGIKVKIDDALTFDYEDNNNIGDKYMPDLDDEERNDLAWNARNPEISAASLLLRNGAFGVEGPLGTSDNAYWTMNALQANKVYNVFSDEGIQVNGKFSGGKPQELGFVVDGDEVKVIVDGTKTKVTVNGEVQTTYDSEYIKLTANGELTITSGDTDDENYKFTVNVISGSLDMKAVVKNIGSNDTRSSGLLGDALSGNITNKPAGQDDNGASYLRNQDGSLSKAGDSMTKALREYLVDDLFDTSSGRSVYD
ncbi:MAG: hypothetical protein NWR47_07285 [Aestuariivirgaceae bacterium]|nr:hypothetical protein [Aestuariivirgaceae bacterium]